MQIVWWSIWTGNRIGDEGAKAFKEIAVAIRQQRVKQHKQLKEAIALVLLAYATNDDESIFHILPLEIIHMIIRFVLEGKPASNFELITWDMANTSF